MALQLTKAEVTRFLTEREYHKLIKFRNIKRDQITTANDLLLCNNSYLLMIADHEHIRYEKLLELREFYRNIDRERNREMNVARPKVFLRHGSPRLNTILSTLPPQSIIQLHGAKQSGKTRFLLDCVYQTLAECQQQILFVDIDLSFPEQMFNRNFGDKQPPPPIQLCRVNTIAELFDLFQVIRNDESLHNSLLMIDSLTAIFHTSQLLKTKEEYLENHERLLSQFCELLKSVTFYANLITIYTLVPFHGCRHICDHLTLRLSLDREPSGEGNKVSVTNISFESNSKEEFAI